MVSTTIALVRPKCHIFAYVWSWSLSLIAFLLQSLSLITLISYAAASKLGDAVYCNFGPGRDAAVAGILVCATGYIIASLAQFKEFKERPKDFVEKWIAQLTTKSLTSDGSQATITTFDRNAISYHGTRTNSIASDVDGRTKRQPLAIMYGEVRDQFLTQ
ncbi:hypothetical protein ACOME3_002891 [Neoechinorhynchus agilis]